MGLRKATPGEGAGSGHVHFRYVGTDPGDRWFAWVAGPAYWLLGHPSSRSKPCLDWLTEKALPCAICSPLKPPVMMGYLPLYRQIDGAPVMVVVYETVREKVDALKLHKRVQVGRELGEADSVWVSLALEQNPRFQTTLKQREQPADVTETLLRMWKMPELVNWYRCQTPQSDNPVSLPEGVAVTSAGTPYSPMSQAAAKRFGADVLPIPTGDATFEEARRKLLNRAASTNGKHDTTKPKG